MFYGLCVFAEAVPCWCYVCKGSVGEKSVWLSGSSVILARVFTVFHFAYFTEK